MTRIESNGAGFYRRLCLARLAFTLALALGSAGATACFSVPITNRSAFNAFPIGQDKQLGQEAYAEVMAQSKLANDQPEYAMVKRACDRLVQVADDPANFEWEVNLIDDPKMVNAWCMPGGKMAVYTGILPLMQDETGVAVVMGHEIAHAAARHGTEGMTREVGLAVVIEYLAGNYKVLAGGLANVFISLNYGREQELEADYIGLIYLARAGYDPAQAIEFWKRMAAQGGEQPPEYLSTHPSHERRIAELERHLPEARKAYNKARKRLQP